MNQSEMFAVIRHAIDTAEKGDKTVTIQLQIIKFHKQLKQISAKEFVEEIGLKPSLVTLFNDSMKLASKLQVN
ncbi:MULTISPECIES: HTH-like domain-containing protein [Citrobacter freundii complex]|jgi:hypothetical protein|uniref:HTH-like domain-containing protein n=1 Tax=Citrobacter freundii complex TaxID=1344959 RepID=UPI0015E9A31B|nr:transcription factor [Citrobacter freundii]EKU2184464.1 hypothetical protein [Citrobacter freundii]MDX6983699.1 hypothetical protein [Citrobacter freundii]QLW74286.1 transcription factor [Citrobacter freundii]